MMNPNTSDFNSGVVAPFECLKEGWAAIKDRYWLFLGLALVAMLIGGAVRAFVSPRPTGPTSPSCGTA